MNVPTCVLNMVEFDNLTKKCYSSHTRLDTALYNIHGILMYSIYSDRNCVVLYFKSQSHYNLFVLSHDNNKINI